MSISLGTFIMIKDKGKVSALYRFLHPRVLTIHPDYKSLEPFILSLPMRFRRNEGVVIHRGRNELRRMEYGGVTYVVKSFHQPNWLNRVIYGVFRASKAKRSFLYADAFLKLGVGTPQPVGSMDQRQGLLFDKSYYVSCLSDCPYVYSDLFVQKFECEEKVLREIGRVTAILHENGYAHKDYGRGNILFRPMPDGSAKIEIVDLNRMYIGHIGLRRGCRNFERLPATPEMHRYMAEEYAKVRGFDAEKCFQLMSYYRSRQSGKIDNLY